MWLHDGPLRASHLDPSPCQAYGVSGGAGVVAQRSGLSLINIPGHEV